MEKIARGRGRETNIARGEKLFIVLAGLFEQIAKVLLGAIKW